jgi:hypothetical protein
MKLVTEKEFRAVLQLFLQTGIVRILPFVVLLQPNQKNEHVLHGPISVSERSDSQANSVRKACSWSFPIV